MRTASGRYLNPLRLLPSYRSHTHEQLPSHDRLNGISPNPSLHKSTRVFSMQGVSQRLRFFRSPIRLLASIIVCIVVIVLLTTNGYHHDQSGGGRIVEFFDGSRNANGPEERWRKAEKERAQGTQHIWEDFPRFVARFSIASLAVADHLN